MTPATCHVSVIICAYTCERWDDLIAAIESLQKQTHKPDEIILVIDHNPNLFQQAQQRFNTVTVVENSDAQGLSGARNTGIALAHGAYIVFMDDDAEADVNWLKCLLQCCEAPHVLGVGGTVVPRWQGRKPGWFPSEFYWVVGCTYQSVPDRPIVVRNPYGGCTCIKREVFQEIGGFREGIGRVGINSMGGEETELSIRASRRWPEKVFLYEPLALIHHRIPPARACWRYFFTRCHAEGLSKALISKYVGTRHGLSSERSYAFRTLPLAILNNITDTVFHSDFNGFLRAGAIVAGLAVTTVGYLTGRLLQRPLPSHQMKHETNGEFQPITSIHSENSTQAQIY